MPSLRAWLCLLALILHASLPVVVVAEQGRNKPFAVVRPVADHSKLELDETGLAVLEGIQGPVSPVVVIGPYRSGKSFLLNQLMGVPCDQGFGVGHSRHTQTKGVWMWGEPAERLDAKGDPVQLLFFDTEGFESTGKADVYDDRIFALSTVISAVLVYNLPEAIRESDLERLSFAVELAKAFYADPAGREPGGLASPPTALEPGAMLWLIQRDFLQGDSLEETLAAALAPVPNPARDPGLTQLNRIRVSLHALARNSSALGLPQPHLDRTALCGLADEELAPGYRTARAALEARVAAAAAPKLVRGRALDGAALARLIRDVVAALNSREIPTAGSLVEYFNRELVQACKGLFVDSLGKLALPASDEALGAAVAAARAAALRKFGAERFGAGTAELEAGLARELDREAGARGDANEAASARACDAAEEACEDALEAEARQRLPAARRFRRRHEECLARFARACVGPARTAHSERLAKAWEREHTRFLADYNARLLNGLTLCSIAGILLFRFVVRVQLGESVAWGAFVFFQVYPRSFLGDASMYDQAWWQGLVSGWEAVASNPFLDLERGGLPLLGGAVLLLATRRWWKPRAMLALRRWRRRRRGQAAKESAERDLNV
uniref:GB1/RHD3-type G domain-containing protein n=1 Tax=Auxenochlorella protothecoides TaxID=3075 RepID=A0A1D1ZYE9_AUXPR